MTFRKKLSALLCSIGQHRIYAVHVIQDVAYGICKECGKQIERPLTPEMVEIFREYHRRREWLKSNPDDRICPLPPTR